MCFLFCLLDSLSWDRPSYNPGYLQTYCVAEYGLEPLFFLSPSPVPGLQAADFPVWNQKTTSAVIYLWMQPAVASPNTTPDGPIFTSPAPITLPSIIVSGLPVSKDIHTRDAMAEFWNWASHCTSQNLSLFLLRRWLSGYRVSCASTRGTSTHGKAWHCVCL